MSELPPTQPEQNGRLYEAIAEYYRALDAGQVPDREFAFQPNGELMAIAHSRWQVRLVDTKTRKPVATLTSLDERPVRRLMFSPDGTRLAIARDDNVIHVWDLRALGQQMQLVGLAQGWPRLPHNDFQGAPRVVLPNP